MFKRVLVLVVFLFAVFWWLTHRGGDDVEPTTPDTTVEETTETENSETVDTETETEVSPEVEAETETAVETTPETPAPATPVETPTTTPTSTPVTTPVVTTPAPTTTPEVVETTTPVAPTPTTPVVTEPAVPNRVTDVKVYVYEWNVDLSDKTIPAGTVNFKVQNDGRFTHDFSLTGHGNLGKVMPGETKTFTVKLRAGEYEAFSERRQDYERGVREDFVVTP